MTLLVLQLIRCTYFRSPDLLVSTVLPTPHHSEESMWEHLYLPTKSAQVYEKNTFYYMLINPDCWYKFL